MSELHCTIGHITMPIDTIRAILGLPKQVAQLQKSVDLLRKDLKDMASNFKAELDAMAAQTTKVFGEIRGLVDDLKSKITDVETAFANGRAAQKADDESAQQAADAETEAAIAAVKAPLNQLDAMVEDAPTP